MELITKKKILIGPSSFAATDKEPMERLLKAGYEIIDNPYKRKLTKEELFHLLTEDVIGIIAGLEPLDREVMGKSNLKVISRVGSGLSNVDLKGAEELKIKVFSTPQGPTEAVAELTIGAMLCVMRMITQMDQALHNGQWNKKIGYQIQGKTIAIIGFGRIGKRVAELLIPFGVKIIVVDPYLTVLSNPDYKLMSLNEALTMSDIISIHSSGENCILGENEFSIMKKGVFILNVARGSLVSEEALIKSLDEEKVSGAWLDTFKQEPYQGPLSKYPNVVLTPHVGSYTAECRKSMEMEAVENLLQGLKRIK